MANPTADKLFASISMLAPPQLQENDDLLSSGSTSTEALYAFNLDEYLQDFGCHVLPPTTCDAPRDPV